MGEEREPNSSAETERLVELYGSLGWTLLRVAANTKVPPKGSTIQQFIASPATAEVALGWLNQGDNIGVLLGDPSGGVVCRDFDKTQSYDLWAVRHPELAARLPRVETHRGFHVFCRSLNPEKTVPFGDGELRSTGAYVLLPPSIHPLTGNPSVGIQRDTETTQRIM